MIMKKIELQNYVGDPLKNHLSGNTWWVIFIAYYQCGNIVDLFPPSVAMENTFSNHSN